MERPNHTYTMATTLFRDDGRPSNVTIPLDIDLLEPQREPHTREHAEPACRTCRLYTDLDRRRRALAWSPPDAIDQELLTLLRGLFLTRPAPGDFMSAEHRRILDGTLSRILTTLVQPDESPQQDMDRQAAREVFDVVSLLRADRVAREERDAGMNEPLPLYENHRLPTYEAHGE